MRLNRASVVSLLLLVCIAAVSATSNVLTSSSCYWLPGEYGDCAVSSCGSGVKSRDVSCYCDGAVAETSSCDADTTPAVEASCTVACLDYEWTVTSWTGCNVSCGTGYNSREVECKTSAGASAEQTYCLDSATAPDQQTLCTPNSDTCTETATWNWGEWSDCSASCGTGHQSRDRWCVGVGGEIIDDTSCDCDSLHTFRECNYGDCETWAYSTGSYGDCSVTCGSGYQERDIECVSSVRGTVAFSECESAGLGSAPTQVDTCTASDYCPSYEWQALGYGDCSVTCGSGQKTQSIQCVESHSEAVVSDEYCTGTAPDTVASCTADITVCETWGWKTTSWSDCPVTCGYGQETRTVTCVGSLSADDVDTTNSFCSGSMPAQIQSCNAGQCPYCTWVPGAYGDCSATCGDEGVWTRSVSCLCDGSSAESSACANVENVWATQESCGVRSCPTYSWNATGFSDCSVTCGTGFEYQTVHCVSDSDVIVDMSYCEGENAPDTQEECDSGVVCPTPHYTYGSWASECSASCGWGTQTRSVWCSFVGSVVDSSECVGAAPDSSKSCYDAPCETYSWETSSYSECSATCQGLATRSVWCESSLGTVVHSYHCDETAGTKPDTSYVCASDACPVYDWVPGSWSSDCSVTCGTGVTSMSYQCENVVTSEVVADKYCGSITKPTSTQSCSYGACEIFDWVPYSWSTCSVSCGDGVSSREVLCQGLYSGEIDTTNTLCNSTRPSLTEDCTEAACPTYGWYYGSYSECSSCSKTRSVWCQSSTGATVDDSYCVDTKPSTSSSCISSSSCSPDDTVIDRTYTYTVGDWSVCSAACGDGTETRTVACNVNITIITDDVVTSTTVSQVELDACVAVLGTVEETQQSCSSGVVCDTYYWKVGSYGSDCSASCGSGHVSRSVECMDAATSDVVDDSLCTGTKPDTTTDCNMGACDSWNWVVGSYGDCTVTCGLGLEERTVTCMSSLHGPVADSYCVDNVGSAPSDNQVCGPYPECVVCTWSKGDWSDCSASCGVGQLTRDATCSCSDGSVDSTGASCTGSQPATSQVCQDTACTESYHYVPQSWSDCSVTCGTGTYTRGMLCVGDVSGTIDTTGLQCSGETMPDTVDSCTAEIEKCETWGWVYSSFGECSVTCGFGQQTRTATCTGSFGDVDKTGAECAGLTEEALYQDCFPKLCEVCDWLVGSYSDCGVSCGAGSRTREVACVGSDGDACEVSACDAATQPEATTVCDLTCCTTYSWYVGGWGDCSVSCGAGTKSREAYCHDAEGLIVDAEYCSSLGSTPSVDEVCTESDCTGPAWANGDWSSCSSSCGAGSRTRDVYCRAVDGSTLDDSACSTAGDAPADTEDCNLCACESFDWEVSTYADCSASCGVGYEERTVNCRSSLRGYVANGYCTDSKPVDNRECTAVCWSWIVGEWGDCSVSSGTGTRTRNVYCVSTAGEVDASGTQCSGSAPVDAGTCSV